MRAWLCCVLLTGCQWAFGIAAVPVDAFVPPGRWVSIALGATHACALDIDGHLACWGDDRHGELGGAMASTKPQRLGTDTWTAIAAGTSYSCGLRAGKVSCWGRADAGQVTGIATADVRAPVVVPMPIAAPPFEKVGAGHAHACALGAGQIWCWGDSRLVGTGSGTTAPQQVAGSAKWHDLAVGFDHTCAVDDAGGVWCWGLSDHGQTGQGTSTPVTPVPAQIAGLPAAAIALAAGTQRSCAVLGSGTAGQLWCWGSAADMTLDAGTLAEARPPTQILAGDDWTGVTAGNAIVCGLRSGAALCWGTARAGGFGDGVWTEAIPPTSASRTFPASVVTLARGPLGEELACAIDAGNLTCWGDNRGGQLGAPATLHLAPVVVAAPTTLAWQALAVGTSHTCATDTTGATSCWGADDLGQVTGAAGPDRPTPSPAPSATAPNQLVAGQDFTCAHTGSSLACWGTNAGGELGTPDGSAHTSQRGVVPDVALIGGSRAICDYGPTTPLECWGVINGGPQRAPGAIADPAGALTGIYSISFGDRSTCAIVAQNRRACWGLNYQAELGNGTSDMTGLQPPTSPVVFSDDSYSAVSNERWHACALTATNTIKCWGSNFDYETGQFPGDPSLLTKMPAPVGNLVGCTRISTTYATSCAICGGIPQCWGALRLGGLGRDTDATNDAPDPAPVLVPAGKKWTELGSGGVHSCALASDGTLACWGLGVRGEIGDGSHGSTVPVVIAVPD